jgi:hypothetical protein
VDAHPVPLHRFTVDVCSIWGELSVQTSLDAYIAAAVLSAHAVARQP